jgi:transcriptional regulator with XRE-family HTH domain
MEDNDKTALKRQIGGKIKRMREEKRMARQQVADALNMSLTNYGYIECGKIDMPMTRLVDIARVFEVSVDDLLELSDKTVFTFSGIQNKGDYNYQVNSPLTETTEIVLKHELEKALILLQEREKEVTGLQKQIEQLEKIVRLHEGEKFS